MEVSDVIIPWGREDQSHCELHFTPVRVAETKNSPSRTTWART